MKYQFENYWKNSSKNEGGKHVIRIITRPINVAGGNGEGLFFKKGEVIRKIKEEILDMVDI